jgi:hypothetical protein
MGLGRHGIRDSDQLACVQFVIAHWDSLPASARGWGVWIVQHDEMPPRAVDRATDVVRAWFLTTEDFASRDPSAYARFSVVHSGRAWCRRMDGHEPSSAFGRVHEIASAAFARFVATRDLYLDYIWGNLFGRGYRCRVTENARLQIRRSLWCS